MSFGKERLIELEKTGKYVFHGSGYHGEELTPQQAFRSKDGEKKKDDSPGVHASPSVDYAIMMALINDENCPNKRYSEAKTVADSKESDRYELHLSASKETLDQLSDTSEGWVYVFSKELFKKRNPTEWISYDPITPLEKIRVIKEDLPEITIV